MQLAGYLQGNQRAAATLEDLGRRTTLVRLDDKLRVATSPALIGDLKQLLGPACVS